MARPAQSVEPNVADRVNGWLRSYGVDYKLEQESLNDQIDDALRQYLSKAGGKGGNRPDAKLIKQTGDLDWIPVLIEYKGRKGRLVKFKDGQVDNHKVDGEPNYKNIRDYAVNGAIHYANAVLQHTDYNSVIAIGVTGWKDAEGELQLDIGVYHVSNDNLGAGQEVGKYSDLSFLRDEAFDAFMDKVRQLSLTPAEKAQIRTKREQGIKATLRRVNHEIYNAEKGLSETDRVYLVTATIMATLGVPGEVSPLKPEELQSKLEYNSRDGDIILNKIVSFLYSRNIPAGKRDTIRNALANTLLTDNINKPTNGESQLKRVFTRIADMLGYYYQVGLTTDFTGALFNEMYGWLGFTQDKLNDVVLTPSYVATLLAKLARVDRNSYVWDFATGSAGLLVAAMNEMLDDAENHCTSPDEYERTAARIRGQQLMGLEILSNIHMLATLNMILMGDGSSNLINQDSLLDFDGTYPYTPRRGEKFPATAFVLNPPYSAPGCGMVFVRRALSMMDHGYAAVIIQGSAGSGKAKTDNIAILQHSTLLASIKMPVDLFLGKSSVQTYIYVFRVGEAHHPDNTVRFIDFSDDGYERTNRKKASVNLRDKNHAKERYQEVVDIVRFGTHKAKHLPADSIFEGTIDPTSGADWNQSAPLDTTPTLDDFKKTVGDYLAWEVSRILKGHDVNKEDERLGK